MLESASEPPAEVEGALWRPVLWAPDGAVEGTAKFDLGLSVAGNAAIARASAGSSYLVASMTKARRLDCDGTLGQEAM